MQPPSLPQYPSPYTNGMSPAQYQHSSQPPTPAPSAYPTPQHAGQYPAQQQQGYNFSALPHENQKPWNPVEREAWLNSLDTRLGGDDIAAFVDGGEWADWAQMAASQGFANGWLTTVWGGNQP